MKPQMILPLVVRNLISEMAALIVLVTIVILRVIIKFDSRLIIGLAIFFLMLTGLTITVGVSDLGNTFSTLAFLFIVVGVIFFFIELMREQHSKRKGVVLTKQPFFGRWDRQVRKLVNRFR